MKKLLFTVLMLSLLSGCATTSMVSLDQAPDLTPRTDQATLVIVRDTFFGGPIVFWHYLDGTFIGETQGQSYFVTPVSPGPHYVVVTSENTAVAYFDFKPGKTYYLGEGVTMGVWRARTSGFYPLTREAALEAMKSASHLQYDPARGSENMDAVLYQQAIEEYQQDVKENPDSFKEILSYDGV
ncbi:DUF2846 domain-containing protein [Desulfofustis glycolicus]|uniref:DUF2846 domain-containing protein n=1 Tax=Desulfofustis glycolicus DSM 9705 TaxID=1121409 RepID=A0A1M5V4Z8_9BACT|nr:DUF2846 domain-containing protein [Desulfofustis glycolicus]MCB2214989.1 DUF2846 domain-containing protein [Desulfobulbaceae bacterium]SHH70329.1 Protein of unknown function [Desulfofustis glycolicus DSM 9705]